MASSASLPEAKVTKPKPLEPRSLKIISTSRMCPKRLKSCLKSGSRNLNGMLLMWSRFDLAIAESNDCCLQSGATVQVGGDGDIDEEVAGPEDIELADLSLFESNSLEQ